MGFFDAIAKLFASLFGGKKNTDAETVTKKQVAETATEELFAEKKMAMKESVFSVMTAAEDEAWKPILREQMAEKDAVKTLEYTLSTDKWIYKIVRPIVGGKDLTDEYGTQYTATQKHK